MKEHFIVCPFDENLLKKFNQKAVVIKTNDVNIISYIYDRVNQNNHLHAIVLYLEKPISDITFDENWKNIPLAIYSPELGLYKKVLSQVQLLKQMNLKIFLDSGIDINFTCLKILSSLQIACGIYFNSSINWEKMSDLLHYAVYTKIPHAPIEPFEYIIKNYRADDFTDFSSVYFDNYRSYIHLNQDGNIALSSNESENNNFISCDISTINEICNTGEYHTKNISWQKFFLERRNCAYCPAWRICLGKFIEKYPDGLECKSFFSEVMEAVDFYRLRESKFRGELWQS